MEDWVARSGRRASGQVPDLQTPFFRPGGVLMRPDDGGIDDQIFEVWVTGRRLEDPPPNTLDAPSAEAPEYASSPRTPQEDHARQSPYARSKAQVCEPI